jgi:hypothetical protein
MAKAPHNKRPQAPNVPASADVAVPSIAEERSPTAYIAELYGRSPDVYKDRTTAIEVARLCPFRKTKCDVTANRNRVATLNLTYKGVKDDAESITGMYGSEPLPLGICSCWTTRQNETAAKPWILCPKRLLTLEPPCPLIPREVRQLIGIDEGARVGVWSELKLRVNDKQGAQFFEYTFDYLLMEINDDGEPVGVPYIIEVMTSSTRGGGLSEHMADTLLGRKQRHLGNVVDSVYTPNYRQVFGRMVSQFVAKSEIAEAWGGRAIWVFQDVLLDYIEQTTAFDSKKLKAHPKGNVYGEVYSLKEPDPTKAMQADGLQLVHHQSLRGRARLIEHSEDYTAFLGLGFSPSLDELRKTLRRGYKLKQRKPEFGRLFFFRWGEDYDPRDTEPAAGN